MADLFEVIGNHAIVGISVAVKPKEYVEIFNDAGPSHDTKRFKSVYFFLLFSLILKLCDKMKSLGLHGSVDFIFDSQVMEERKILAAWQEIIDFRLIPTEIVTSSLVFENDKNALPLQAADMFAGRMLYSLRENFDIVAPLDIRTNIGQNVIPCINYVWTLSALKQFRNWFDLSQKATIRGTFDGRQFVSFPTLLRPRFS